MSLYQELAEECKIQENSRIVVSEEKLKKFVELIAFNLQKIILFNWVISLGYLMELEKLILSQ